MEYLVWLTISDGIGGSANSKSLSLNFDLFFNGTWGSPWNKIIQTYNNTARPLPTMCFLRTVMNCKSKMYCHRFNLNILINKKKSTNAPHFCSSSVTLRSWWSNPFCPPFCPPFCVMFDPEMVRELRVHEIKKTSHSRFLISRDFNTTKLLHLLMI